MSPFPEISDDDFERLLGGNAPAGDELHEDLKEFLHDAREVFPASPVDPPVEAAHLASMMEAAHLLADKGEPVMRSVSAGPARHASTRPSMRRNRVRTPDVKARLLRSPVGKVAATLVAMFTIFSGVALAGVLPAPVQKAVSHVAGSVGIHLPSPADDEGEAADDQGEDDQGEDGDDQGGNGNGDRENGNNDGPKDDHGHNNDNQGGKGNGARENGNNDGSNDDNQGHNNDDQSDNNDDQGESDDQGQDGQSGGHPGDQNEESDHHGAPSESGHDHGGSGDDQGDEDGGHHSGGSDHEGDSHEGSDGGSGGSSGGGDQGNDEGGSGD